MAITVKGDRKAISELGALKGQVASALFEAIDDEAKNIRADERRMVPVKTGALQRGIIITRKGGRGWRRREIGIVDPGLKYAVWIEWGRKNAPAQPFATPSAELARPRWSRRVEEAIKGVV